MNYWLHLPSALISSLFSQPLLRADFPQVFSFAFILRHSRISSGIIFQVNQVGEDLPFDAPPNRGSTWLHFQKSRRDVLPPRHTDEVRNKTRENFLRIWLKLDLFYRVGASYGGNPQKNQPLRLSMSPYAAFGRPAKDDERMSINSKGFY